MKRFFRKYHHAIIATMTVLIEVFIAHVVVMTFNLFSADPWRWPDRIDVLTVLLVFALVDIANNEIRMRK